MIAVMNVVSQQLVYPLLDCVPGRVVNVRQKVRLLSFLSLNSEYSTERICSGYGRYYFGGSGARVVRYRIGFVG